MLIEQCSAVVIRAYTSYNRNILPVIQANPAEYRKADATQS